MGTFLIGLFSSTSKILMTKAKALPIQMVRIKHPLQGIFMNFL